MTSHIYHGPWVNWSHGNLITGATLTLSERNGGLLTSFIATFVTLVGVQLWKILAFAIHQIRSTSKPEDGLYHQQQVVWRNSSAPGGAAWTFLQQIWYWRNRANKSFIRSAGWAIFASVYLIVFAVAAVFSSEISKAPGSQRLIIGDTCGYWAIDGASASGPTALDQKLTNESQVVAAYARGCYGGSYDSRQCSRYPVPSISWDHNQNATCPFKSGMCVYGNQAAYQMTSKTIDSQMDLGINTPVSQRVQLQKRTTCAPIIPEGYMNLSSQIIDNGDGTTLNNTWLETHYGPFYLKDNDPASKINYTARVSVFGYYAKIGYQLSSLLTYANTTAGSKGWNPISNLYQKDADMIILSLRANSLRFESPVEDPWFEALTPVQTWYESEYFITTLACTEQYHICNPNTNRCSDWLGATQMLNFLTNGSAMLGFDTLQEEIAGRMSYAAFWSSIYYMTFTRGALALRAQETVSELEQAPLPANQWHREVSAWFDGGLAFIQRNIISYAAADSLDKIPVGAKLIQPAKNLSTAAGIASQYMCWNQLINDSSDTMSFSMLGMTILFTVGGVIILTSLIIDRVVAFAQSFFKFNLHGQHAWALDDKLQLQKSLFDRAGMGVWKVGNDDAIPVAAERVKFSRFTPDQVFTRDDPATLSEQDSLYPQKTEYLSPSAKEPGVYVQQQH